jgi:hypothetical protein
MTETVRNKAQMYRMLARGDFGNTVPQWFTVAEFLEDDPPFAEYGVRSLAPGKRCDYHVAKADVPALCREWPPDSRGFNVSPMLESYGAHRVFQGQARRFDDGLHLWYSLADLPSRVALQEHGDYVVGLRAKMLVEHFCDPSSAADLFDLLDDYPGHVVEFSTCDRNVGRVPNRNTVVWEVRGEF